MECSIMRHFIWVFAVCKNINEGVSSVQIINVLCSHLSKKLNNRRTRIKIARNSVFDYHLSPVGLQLAIENCFWWFLSSFGDSINVFDCRISGVVLLERLLNNVHKLYIFDKRCLWFVCVSSWAELLVLIVHPNRAQEACTRQSTHWSHDSSGECLDYNVLARLHIYM